MQTDFAANQETASRPIQPGSTLVAWLLMFMAISAFAPCVLLPEWRVLQSLRVAEQQEQRRLTSMQGVVDHERRWINAIQADPIVAERLASRELGFTNPATATVAVAVNSAPAANRFRGRRSAGTASPPDTNQSRWRQPADPYAPATEPGNPASLRPVLGPDQPPDWIARAAATLPNLNYDAVFCDPQTRLVVMALSLALLSVAIYLPNRRSIP